MSADHNTRHQIEQDIKLSTKSSWNLPVHFVTAFPFFQMISLSKTCWCFPSTDQSVEPNTNATEPKLIAVILQNPFSAKSLSVGDVQSRYFKGFLNWLQSLGSAASQTAGDNVPSGTTGTGNFLTSLLGGQNSFAYPFPFRRWSYARRTIEDAEAQTRLRYISTSPSLQ